MTLFLRRYKIYSLSNLNLAMIAKFIKKNKSKLDKPVTLGLLMEYTDEILVPTIVNIFREEIKPIEKRLDGLDGRIKAVEDRMNRVEYNLKDYIDKKMADYTSDIFKRLDKKYQKDFQFKKKVVELFKKHNIGNGEELAFLEGLVAGG